MGSSEERSRAVSGAPEAATRNVPEMTAGGRHRHGVPKGNKGAAENRGVQEERYHKALKGSSVLVYECDRELRYTFVDNPQPPVTDPALILGRRDDEILPAESVQEMVEIKKLVLATGKGQRREICIRNGEKAYYFDFLAEPMRSGDESITGLRGVVVDITARKQAEEALRESEERLRESERHERERASELAALLDAAPTPVFIAHDPECLHLTGNRAAAEFLRQAPGGETSLSAPEEVRPRHFKAVQNGRELRTDELPAQRAARGVPVKDFEFSLVFNDGITCDVVGYGTPLRDAQGRPRGAIHVLVDITERKRAEEQLRQAHERLTYHTQNTPLAVIEFDAELRVCAWSDGAQRVFGWEVSEVLGRRIFDIPWVLEEDRPAIEQVAAGLRTGRTRRSVSPNRNVRKDGKVIWCEWYNSSLTDASGKMQSIQSLVLEVTERREAEQALQRSEARLAQAMQVGRLGTFEHDHVAEVLEFSPLMRELAGFGETERVTVDSILARVAAEDRHELAAAIRRAHDPTGNGMFRAEYRVVRSGGEVRWLSARSQTFFEGEGSRRRPVRTIGAVLDVTERKEAQAGLERLVAERTAKLQELVGELEHFSYSITHDMRAPLRAMRGFAELLKENVDKRLGQEEQMFVGRIIIGAERMDALIADALSYSKAVRQELAVAPVDVGRLLRGMLDTYPEFQSTNAAITIDGELPIVMGNEAGLTQCFSNLLVNAVKFVQQEKKAEVRVRGENRGGWVRLWVEDNGIGIPGEMLSRVFDMFSRGTSPAAGTGIGLALVRKVVDRMGGKVGVESEVGRGSRFWVELRAGDLGHKGPGGCQ